MISINENTWFPDCFNVESVSALKLGDKEICYYEMKNKISSLSNYFISQGITSKQNISVLFTSQYGFIISVYSLWNIGAIPVLINNKLNETEILEQIKFVESSLLITDFNDTNFDGIKIIKYSDDYERVSDTLNNLSYENTALMLFTSGSSGVPKCVSLSFNNLISNVLISDKQFNYLQNSKWIASLPFYHIGGFMIFFRALLTSSNVILLDERKCLIKKIENENAEYISLVPTQLRRLLDENVSFNSNLKNIFLGGGPIDFKLLNLVLQSNLPITPVYGSTETSSMISYQTFNDLLKEEKISLLPFDGIDIKIIKYKEDDKIGEIAIKSASLFSEYYKNEKETRASFNGEFYLTSDLGYFENGRLNIVGRKDDTILSGGENISGREIETEILKIEKVEKAVVVGIDDAKWGKAAAALVQTSLTKDEIEKFLREKFPSYKIPKIIKTTSKIPCNEIGKLDRKKVERILTS